MAENGLTAEELAERVRLTAWMKANGHDTMSLARATGDAYALVQMMTEGNRRISQGFKWRFYLAFGKEITDGIFLTDDAPSSKVPA